MDTASRQQSFATSSKVDVENSLDLGLDMPRLYGSNRRCDTQLQIL